MHGLRRVLCLCPASRLSVASLVLSTWTDVEQCIFVDHVPAADALRDVDAVIVMDQFVATATVHELSSKPVFVLAWNGTFEIARYRELLAGCDVRYLGTSERMPGDPSYLPFINGDCEFAQWAELYESKRQFSARGSAGYKLRYARARLMTFRAFNIAVAAAGALTRPRALRRTVESGVVSDKLVWAGHCYFDNSVGLSGTEHTAITSRLEEMNRVSDPEARLDMGLELVGEWRARMTADLAHQAFYVTNTLLRWSVLRYLADTVRDQTWFFGWDNLGLGLELELYVHNLVPAERVAFLELGGTKTGHDLYPRALHLLARRFYVISVPADGAGDVAGRLARLRAALASPREFFTQLESRRRSLYAGLPAATTLRDVHHKVWSDFESFEEPAMRTRRAR